MRAGFVMALISAALFAWVLGSEADEIGLRDLAVLGLALIAILAAQLLFLWALEALARPLLPKAVADWIVIAVATVLLVANAYSFAFLTLEVPMATSVVYSASVGAVFLILVSLRQSAAVLGLFAAIMIVMSVAQYTYVRAAYGGRSVEAETKSLPVHSKRNVYIIGFESLHSPKAYREIYGLDKLEYVQVMRDAGFRVLDRAYSANGCTLCSYAMIFEFVRQFQNDDLGLRFVFASDNSTFRSFRESGYAIQFIYVNDYFALNRNNVDYAFPPLGFDACDNLGPRYFYGLCRKRNVKAINYALFGKPRVTHMGQIAELKRRVDIIVKSGQPWLTFAHIKYPFHSGSSISYPTAEYQAEFKERVAKAQPKIADNMRNTVGYIVARDPDAVVVAFGDHGASLYRGVLSKELLSDKPRVTFATRLEDRNGVQFAVYPADFCLNRMAEPFATTHLVENLIACLNGDDHPTEEEKRLARTIRFVDGHLIDVGDPGVEMSWSAQQRTSAVH